MIKKIIWFLMIFPMFLSKANAYETYYTDYSNYTDFQEKEVLASELVNVIEETRYLWYKKEIVEQYELYTKGHEYEDCYETEFSSWYEGTANKLLQSRTYETRTRYDYKMALPVRYIHLTNLDSYDNFKLTEIKIYINGKQAKFTTQCEGCSTKFSDYVKNDIVDEDIYINNSGSLSIDLGTSYPIDDINIVLYINDSNHNKEFTLSFESDNKVFSKNYAIEPSETIISKTIYDIEMNSEKWLYKKTNYNFFTNDFVFEYNMISEYRYKDKYCKIVKLENIYNDEYTKESVQDYIYKDEEKSKKFYKYQTRDKIVLDIYEINDKNFDLNNFVVYSSSDYEIIDNIIIYKNGEYQVTFKIDSLEITKKVIVDIEENVVNELENEINELIFQLENSKQILKQEKIKYEDEIKRLNSQINDMKNQLENFENYDNKINYLNELLLTKENIIEIYKGKIIDLDDNIKHLEEQLKQVTTHKQSLNLELKDKQNNIEELEKINEIYKDKISELEIDLKLTNKQINELVTNNNKTLDIYKSKIENLTNKEKENNNKIIQYEELLNEKTIENEMLDNKYNKYILKIKKNMDGISLFFYISLIIIILIYLILYLRKKSNKNNV